MILDLPEYIHCKVHQSVLTDGALNGWEDCYIFAVTCIPNRTPLFTCHTDSGAVFSRLPLWAFRWKNFEPDLSMDDIGNIKLVPWSCIGNKAQAVKHAYLKDYDVTVRLGNVYTGGRYLMTIDYFDGNYSEDPEQHKTHNIIALINGSFAAVPNNACLFNDSHFTTKTETRHYKRNSVYWASEG